MIIKFRFLPKPYVFGQSSLTLAGRIKSEWPALSEGMMALFDATKTNEAQLRAVCRRGDNAEAITRGLPGNL